MTELWKHQTDAISKAMMRKYFGFFFEPGLGKTRAMIEVLRRVFGSHGRILDTVIVTPLITHKNWKEEIQKYSKIIGKDIIILEGSGTNRAKLVRQAAPNKIFICNYEALLNKDLMEAFIERQIRVLICDESHNIKNPTSKRTKAVHRLAHLAEYRYIMTGTPILNNAEDLWSQVYVLDLGERLETKFFYFKTLYFEDKNARMPKHIHFPNWVIKATSKALFNKKMDEISLSAKKDECLDLPPLIRKEIIVELTATQRKHFDEVKKNFISYVKDAACVASIALVKALRMQEIASGFMSLDDGTTHTFDENPKLRALEELIEQYSPKHKIIVWSVFKHDHEAIKQLCEKLKIKYVMLTGNESTNEKFANMHTFENDPDVRICLGSQAVGIGVNLISSSMSIYYSVNFNLGHDIQSEARNYRGGSEIHDTIYRINLIAENTLDSIVHEALRDKKVIGTEILGDGLK